MKSQNLTRLGAAIILGGIAMLAFIFLAGEPEATASTAKTHVIVIRNSQFSPTSLTVSAGDTVIFRNDDIVPHTATGRAFDSGNLNKGQSWKYVAKAKGSFSYICTYHPSMKGRVVVR